MQNYHMLRFHMWQQPSAELWQPTYNTSLQLHKCKTWTRCALQIQNTDIKKKHNVLCEYKKQTGGFHRCKECKWTSGLTLTLTLTAGGAKAHVAGVDLRDSWTECFGEPPSPLPFTHLYSGLLTVKWLLHYVPGRHRVSVTFWISLLAMLS